MLTFWTSCEDGVFKSVVQNTLKNLGKGIEYQKVTFDEENVVYPSKGEVVVVMGAGPLKLMQKEGLVAKNKGIAKMRGDIVPHVKSGKTYGHWMFSYDPSAVKVDIKRDPEVRWDILLSERFHRTGNLDPELGDCEYEYVDDFSETVQYIKDKHEYTGKKVDVALDTETMGLYPWEKDKKIVCVQISVETKQAQVWYCLGAKNKKKVIKQLDWILNSPIVKLKGANLKYDLLWLKEKFALECTNFTFDTLLAGSLLNENRSNSLSGHSKEYTTIGGYDRELDLNYDKAHMEYIPKDDLLPYAGGDTDACLRVSYIFKKELRREEGLSRFYKNILHPAARVFEDVEYHGLCIDQKQFQKVKKEVVREEKRCIEKLEAMMPRRLKMKHADKAHLLVPAVLREFLFSPTGLDLNPQMTTPKTGQPTISYDHLMMFLDNPDAKEFIKTYKELNSAQKTLNTYIDGFLKYVRPDGKFHPTYALFAGGLYETDKDSGTNTGRTSATNPAIQTLPKHTKWAKLLRSCYIAPEDHVIFQCVDPATRIWNADLTWSRADEVRVGDELFAFDEVSEGKHRKMRTAVVTGVKVQKVPKVQITFDDGTYVICSREHQWLSYYGETTHNVFRKAKTLKVGNYVRRVTEVHHKIEDYEAGWLSGFYDGEGWTSGRHGDGGGVSCYRTCDTFDVLRFLQQVRPEMLVRNRTWEGFALPRFGNVGKAKCKAQIVDINDVGVGDVVSIETSTGTYVAEGLCSHNCDFSQGELRITACEANEDTMLDAYHKGIDLHAMTGAGLGGYDLDEFLSFEGDEKKKPVYEDFRFKAKACIAEGQLVLTDRGMVPIEDVDLKDKVWDGVEWVTHKGVLYKGTRKVITYDGLTATPDHPVFNEKAELVPFGCIASKMEGSRTITTEVNGNPVRYTGPTSEDKFRKILKNKGGLSGMRQYVESICEQYFRRKNEELSLSEKSKVQDKSREAVRTKVRFYLPKMQQFVLRMVYLLWGPGYNGSVYQTGVYRVCIKSISNEGLYWNANRSYKQQWELRRRESKSCNSNGEFKKQTTISKSRIQRIVGQRFGSLASIDGRLSRFFFKQKQNSETRGESTLERYTFEERKVYDIRDAGPRNRFTVSGKLVHNCNFGLIYGMQAKGYREYARTGFDLELSLDEAKEQRSLFFETYPGLTFWHTRQENRAHKYKKVVSPLGRVRHLPLIDSKNWGVKSKAQRQAINAPIQSTLSDLCMWSMVLIRERFSMEEVWLAGMTHDSIYGYIPRKYYKERLSEIKYIMENLPLDEVFGWEPQIPFPVDVEVSKTNLGELEKVHV